MHDIVQGTAFLYANHDAAAAHLTEDDRLDDPRDAR